MKNLKYYKKNIWFLMLPGIFFIILFIGCKDTEQTDSASKLERCKILMDQSNWSEAISVCSSVGGDEGKHLTAQAYMASGGLTMLDLLRSLTESTDESGSTSVIFNFVPDTAAKRTSFTNALSYLIGANKIENATQDVYFESLLVSGILILGDLKGLLNITVSDSTFNTCDPVDGTGDTACSFTLDATDDTLSFSGFGSSFYDSICGHSDSIHDSSDHTADAVSVAYDVTNDYCDIQEDSLLNYNKIAFDAYETPSTFQDDSGESILKALDFYTSFNSGNRFTVSGDELVLCHADTITIVSSIDNRLYDCEILGGLLDPSSDSIFN